jgi:hypothetical protein
MATYSIPKFTPSVFNSSDYIDTSYLTKKEADDLYINELPESVERLIGNINVIGEETVTSQVVTGNCLIGGNLSSGKEGDGVSASTASTTVIKGDITLGDQNNPTTVTRALGRVVLGWGQPVHIRGSSININANTENGTSATLIGNGNNPLTVSTGLCSINGNTGATGVSIGRPSSSHTTTIQGNVLIGHTGSGETTIGNGSNRLTVNAGNVLINTNSGATGCTIGRTGSVHTTTINGQVRLGDQNDTSSSTEALGRVKLGWNQNVDIRGGSVNINTETTNTTPNGLAITNIGNGTGEINLNSIDVNIGNDNLNSVTEIKGRTIAIGNTRPPDGLACGIQIGAGGLTADAVGQTNTFVSTVNKIFNPKICDAWGNLTTQNFNLNSPCCAVFSAGTRYVGSSVTLPSTATRTVYLNVPDLTSIMTYPIILDFSHFVFGGFPTTLSPVSTVLVGYDTATSTAMASSEARSKSLACNMVLCVAKATSSSAHKYYFLPNINTTTNPFKSTSIKLKVNNTATTYNYTPFTISKVSETKLRIDVQFPQSSTSWSVTGANDTSANNEFVYSLGFTIRLQTSPSSNSSIGLFPNNSTDSPAGSCWLSLS